MPVQVTQNTQTLVNSVLGNMRSRYDALDLVGTSNVNASVAYGQPRDLSVVSSEPPAIAGNFRPVVPRVEVNPQVTSGQAQAAVGPRFVHAVEPAVQPNPALSAAVNVSRPAVAPTVPRVTIAAQPPQVSVPTYEYQTVQAQYAEVRRQADAKRHAEAQAKAHRYAPTASVPRSDFRSSVPGATAPAIDDLPNVPSTPDPSLYKSEPKLRVPPVDDPAFSPRREQSDFQRKQLVDQTMREMGFAVAPAPAEDAREVENFLMTNAATTANVSGAGVAASPIEAPLHEEAPSRINASAFDGNPDRGLGGRSATPEPAAATAVPTAASTDAPPVVAATLAPSASGDIPPEPNTMAPQPEPLQRPASAAGASFVDPNAPAVAIVRPATAHAAPTPALRGQRSVPTSRSQSAAGAQPVGGKSSRDAAELIRELDARTGVQLPGPAFSSNQINDMLAKRDTPLDNAQRDTLFNAAERAYTNVIGDKEATPSRMQREFPNIVLRKHNTPSIAAVMRHVASLQGALNNDPCRSTTSGAQRRVPVRGRQKVVAPPVPKPKPPRRRCTPNPMPKNFVAMLEERHKSHRLVSHNSAARCVSTTEGGMPAAVATAPMTGGEAALAPARRSASAMR